MSKFEQLPKQIQPAIGYMAYERGHSAGEDEVEMLKESIAADLLEPCLQIEKDAYQRGWQEGKEHNGPAESPHC